MARIGTTKPQSRIYNHALKRYENEFEMEQLGGRVPVNGLTARQRVSEAPLGKQKVIFGGYDAPQYTIQNTEKYYKKKEARDNVPATEYQRKVGTRSFGSFMEQAQSKPYIQIAGKALNGDIHMSAPALDLLTDKEQYKLMTVYKPSMQKQKTETDTIIQDNMKLGKPYEMDKISRANQNVKEFIEDDLQKIELYPSTETNKGDGGSNLKFNFKKEFNQSTNPITTKDLYNKTFGNRYSVSNVNMMQRDAHTARDVLSVYGNKQHTNNEADTKTAPQVRPVILKAQEIEQQKQDSLEEMNKEYVVNTLSGNQYRRIPVRA
jgi:hypothetical protein